MSDNQSKNKEIKTSEVIDWRSAVQDYDNQKAQEKEAIDRRENLRRLAEHRDEQLKNNINKELRVNTADKKKKSKNISGAAIVTGVTILGLQTLRERLLTIIDERVNIAVSIAGSFGIFNFHIPVKKDAKNENYIIDEERLKSKRHIENILKQAGITESPADYFNNQVLNRSIQGIKQEVEKNKPVAPQELIKTLPSKSMLAQKIMASKKSNVPGQRKTRIDN